MTAWIAPPELGPPPPDSTWPRIMGGVHPAAVGTLAPEMLAWVDARALHPRTSPGWRWWQRLASWRALEVDAAGELVWDTVVLSAPRQVGKSWLERGVCMWRIDQTERWGQEQTLLHVAHKLLAAQEVWRPAARWALAQGWAVRKANGEQQIEHPDGSRWLIQAGNDGAGVSFSLTMALVDEAWRIPRSVVDGAINPTLAEAVSPQTWMVSTAGDSTSDLMASNRAAGLAMAEMDDPGSLLLIEWSAPPDPNLDIDDPAVWRAASPYWDARREQRVARARSKATDAQGEVEFRQQWLNQWVPSATKTLIAPRSWAGTFDDGEGPRGRPTFAFDVAVDRSAAVIVAAGSGVVEVVRPGPGDDGAGVSWLKSEVLRLVESWDPVAVIADPSGPAVTAVADLAAELGDRLHPVKARELVAACGEFFDALEVDPPEIAHVSHPALDAAVSGARRRNVSGAWVFDRAGPGGHILIAAALAAWGDRHPVEAPAVEAPMVF